MDQRLVVIGFDGSPASERALRAAGPLLAPRPALVVVVWEAGRAFDLADIPAGLLESPPTTLDIRTALRIDEALYQAAQRLAEHGATLARDVGFDAEGLAVADDLTVADTLVRLVREQDAEALVVGAHGHSELRELLLGSTSRAVIHRAPCPVLVARYVTQPVTQPAGSGHGPA